MAWSAPVKAFGHSIAFAFLFIAGVSLVLAHRGEIRWGAFLDSIISFLIIAFAIFLVVKAINTLQSKLSRNTAEEDEETEIDVLKEIRDQLRQQG